MVMLEAPAARGIWGSVAPRFAWAPPRVRSLGPDCVAFWEAAGGLLFDWQAFALGELLGIGEDEKWASTNDGVDVSRQNGKGVILQAVELFAAFELGYDVVMHTAHEFATSQEHQLRLESLIQDAPHLHKRVRDRGGYRHANGQESINLKSGQRILFKARTTGGGRGYSGDLLVWDEAMVIRDAVVGAQKPMIRASRALYGPKTIYAGSAVDQEIHEYGVNFARLRERGIRREPKVTWIEWSAPVDSLAELTDEMVRDPAMWLAANPSMAEGLISEETMADEMASMPPRTAAVELLGVGDWPRTDGAIASPVALTDWDALFDKDSVLQDPVCLAFDVSPDRQASISAAGRNAEGHWHVEVLESRTGTGWVAGRLADLVEAHDPLAVCCDGYGPAASLMVTVEEAGVEVTKVSAGEHGQACGLFVDAVTEQTVRHLGGLELRGAIRGAATRPLGDAWAWSRKASTVNISPLVSSTLALWAAINRDEQGWEGQAIW